MQRRALVVTAVGVGLTVLAMAYARTKDYADFEPRATMPLLVGITGVLFTASVLLAVLAMAGVQTRAARAADDMTAQLREREEDLVQTNRELERFATIAAHDLQEPLRAILTFTSLIERKFGPGMEGEALSYLLRVSAAGQRIRALIESLLVYARVGQEERQFTTVELADCVMAARANVEALIAETAASVHVGDLPAVRGNAEALTQLFTNLLSNALKYRLGRPEIRISAERRSADWIIHVADNGKGIDPTDHDKIFELFRRLEPGDTARGTGLGLSICARVVDLHGGRIWVKSSVGQGATFSFSFPGHAERRHLRRERA